MDARVPDPPALFTAAAAAQYLNISRASFYRHIVPHVPPLRIGAAPRWRRADLDAWLAQAAAGARDAQR